MNTRILTAAAFSLALVGSAGAVTGTVSPSAPDWQQDASTVQVRDMAAPVSAGEGAPQVGLSPSATTRERNATTVNATEAGVVRTANDAPRSGVRPSAPSQIQDATTVQ